MSWATSVDRGGMVVLIVGMALQIQPWFTIGFPLGFALSLLGIIVTTFSGRFTRRSTSQSTGLERPS